MKARLFLLAALLLLTSFRLAPASGDAGFEAARLTSVAANPPGVSLTLRLPPGRTQFRQGEVIPLTAVFVSSLPNAYQFNTGPGDRDLPWNSDSFHVDNPTNAVDPLHVHYGHVLGEAYSGRGGHFQDLDHRLVTVPYALNECLRFDATSKYRIYLTRGRIIDQSKRNQNSFHVEGRDTTSNAVELKILPEDQAWSARALQDALPLHNADGYDPRKQEAREAAVRTIRYLGTPDKARAMVARYGHYADYAHWNSSPTYSQTRLGLFGFPQPAVVIQGMERRLADPDFPIFNEFLHDLARVQLLAAYP